MPSSIWAGVPSVPEQGEAKIESHTDYVYGILDLPWESEGEQLLIMPRSEAEKLAKLWKLMASTTWGELRKEAGEELYEEFLEMAGYGSFDGYAQHLMVGQPVPGALESALRAYTAGDDEPPADSDPFAPQSLAGYGDGDFPPDLHYVMHESLPPEIMRAYGEIYETVFNGTYVRFKPDVAPAVVQAIKESGHEVIEEQDLLAFTVDANYRR